MRKIILAFVLVACADLMAQRRPMTFEDLAAVRRVGAPRLSPDGRSIAYDLSTINLEENKRRSAIYLIPANGGAARKITDGKEQDEEPVWSPDGKTIAYVSNRDGGPKQIYLYDVAAGTSRQLSTLLNGAGTIAWVPDGSGLLLVSDIDPDCGVAIDCAKKLQEAEEARTVKARLIDSLLFRHWNAWQAATRSHIIFQPLTGEARDLTPGRFDAPPFSVGGGDSFDVSPDGKELAYVSNTDPNAALSTNSDLFLVPLVGGESRKITTRQGADDSPVYSPDGRWIAYRSQSRTGYESDLWELHLYDRRSGTSRRIAADFPQAVDSITWTRDSRALVITAQENMRTAVFRIGLADERPARLYAGGGVDGIEISPDGRRIFFRRSSLIQPAEIFSLSWRGDIANQLTHENDQLLSQIEMGEVSNFWSRGAENVLVQSILVKPPAFNRTAKYPGIVLIHGGPQGAWTDSWSYRWNPQIFAARGYVILMPNPRGSTGYGQKFVEEISRDWAGKVYEDLTTAVDVFAAMPFVDSSRLGAAGASYGGYMVNWILGHTDRFKALLSHAGVFNLESFYGATEELWFPEWEFGGPPWENPDMYARWSPHKFVKNFNTPTLVSHGELDFRVPIGEGLQLFTSLQRRGIPSRFLYFPDEGHWVLKPQNSRLWYATALDWFDRWLSTAHPVVELSSVPPPTRLSSCQVVELSSGGGDKATSARQRDTRQLDNLTTRQPAGRMEGELLLPSSGEMSRALVAEDAEPLRRLLATLLRRQGIEVSTARTGREALSHLQADVYDLILLDLMMPDISGYEVLEWMKVGRPDLLKRLIIVTAVSERELSRVLAENPDIRVVRKPFDIAQVTQMVTSQIVQLGPHVVVACLSCGLEKEFEAATEKEAWISARTTGWHVVTFVREDTGSGRMKTLAITFCPRCASPQEN